MAGQAWRKMREKQKVEPAPLVIDDGYEMLNANKCAGKNPAELPASSPNSGAGTEKRPSLTPLMVQPIEALSRKKQGFFLSANRIMSTYRPRRFIVALTSIAQRACGQRGAKPQKNLSVR